MRTLRLAAALVLSTLGVASIEAQSISGPGASAPPPAVLSLRVIGATSITESTNATTVDASTTVSCNGGAPTYLHTDNSYYRAFTLSAFNPPLDQTQFRVQSVTIGIASANAAGTNTTQPVTLNVYRSTTNPPTSASLTLLSSVTVDVADQSSSLLTVPLTTQPVFSVATGILVVEVFTPNGQASGHSFLLGSNSLGQSAPSYFKASACGVSDIRSLASSGFPNMHIVMTVNGNSQLPVGLTTYSIN
jgi:hypothetical protein